MNILAIDTSCDESCAAVIDVSRWRLLSDVVHTHVDSMTRFGGVVPEVASREHLKGLPLAVEQALAVAHLTPHQIDWIAVTNRPGLIGALLVGVTFAKSMAYALGKPFSTMNHVEAHLYSPLLATLGDWDGKISPSQPPAFPWIALVVSGGHTELFLVTSATQYQWLGGTLDDAAGEAFDKVGKLLGLTYPAGPRIDRWVKESGTEDMRKAYRFPRAKTAEFQFSYSGLKTAVALQVQKLGPGISDLERLSISSSAQEAILDPMIDKIRAAQSLHGVTNVVVCGGVACNSRLRSKLPDAYFPDFKHCSDNAAMIGLLAALQYRAQKLMAAPWNATASPQIEL